MVDSTVLTAMWDASACSHLNSAWQMPSRMSSGTAPTDGGRSQALQPPSSSIDAPNIAHTAGPSQGGPKFASSSCGRSRVPGQRSLPTVPAASCRKDLYSRDTLWWLTASFHDSRSSSARMSISYCNAAPLHMPTGI